MQQVEHNISLLRPGATFREVSEKSWPILDEYVAHRYFNLAHGVGLTGEYPYILHPQDIDEFGYDGVHLPVLRCDAPLDPPIRFAQKSPGL